MNNNFSIEKKNSNFSRLLPQEVNHNMYDVATTLVTTFEGVLPLELLKTRAQKILEANPWLAARLRNDKQTGHPFLWVPAEPTVSPFFEHVEIG